MELAELTAHSTGLPSWPIKWSWPDLNRGSSQSWSEAGGKPGPWPRMRLEQGSSVSGFGYTPGNVLLEYNIYPEDNASQEEGASVFFFFFAWPCSVCSGTGSLLLQGDGSPGLLRSWGSGPARPALFVFCRRMNGWRVSEVDGEICPQGLSREDRTLVL